MNKFILKTPRLTHLSEKQTQIMTNSTNYSASTTFSMIIVIIVDYIKTNVDLWFSCLYL